MTRISSSKTIATSRCSAFFSSFQVSDCWDEVGVTIEQALHDMVQKCTRTGTRERKRAIYRHDNPAGNLFSLCLGMCEVERLHFVVRMIEFLCIIDDVLEELPHREAIIEHDILCEALDDSVEPSTPWTSNTRLEWISFLRQIKDEMLAEDPIRTPALFRVFEQSLRGRESSSANFDTLQAYLPFRLLNFDYEFVTQLLLWAMGTSLTAEETASDLLREFKYSIGVIVGLVNDYFSWEMEKCQLEESDRVRNAVAVVMKERSISDKKAKTEVRKIIMREEQRVQDILGEVHGQGGQAESEALKRYLEELRMFAGGYSYWCATCPRYARPHEEDSEGTGSEDSD
ncbi:hypothetical protein V5O48_006530 [Marasmius crinis-equi]|uniref:Terpene synthase n=1 Tax=Marasmius crinis-equi TaxID=585013 RepID=A0ABR3FJ77_9AGAR